MNSLRPNSFIAQLRPFAALTAVGAATFLVGCNQGGSAEALSEIKASVDDLKTSLTATKETLTAVQTSINKAHSDAKSDMDSALLAKAAGLSEELAKELPEKTITVIPATFNGAIKLADAAGKEIVVPVRWSCDSSGQWTPDRSSSEIAASFKSPAGVDAAAETKPDEQSQAAPETAAPTPVGATGPAKNFETRPDGTIVLKEPQKGVGNPALVGLMKGKWIEKPDGTRVFQSGDNPDSTRAREALANAKRASESSRPITSDSPSGSGTRKLSPEDYSKGKWVDRPDGTKVLVLPESSETGEAGHAGSK